MGSLPWPDFRISGASPACPSIQERRSFERAEPDSGIPISVPKLVTAALIVPHLFFMTACEYFTA
jgi:hypothetical protein